MGHLSQLFSIQTLGCITLLKHLTSHTIASEV